MTTEKFEFDSAIGGDVKLEENIQTFKFASDHIAEINALTNAIANPNSTKLVFQKLPKHMLRRAMSHNPKRLPRKYRQAHTSQMNKSGTPAITKRPSRKYRRKSNNLLVEYQRRQRRIAWLETHIWHAKRFHMVEKWGYKLAQSSCDKTFRSSYRAIANHCLVQDLSYIGCIEISGPFVALRTGFDRMMGKQLGLSICAKVYTNGTRHGTVDLFKPDCYPFGALGRVNFIWKQEEPHQSSVRRLWIFVHPSIYQNVVTELLSLFVLEDTPTLPMDITNDKTTSNPLEHLPPSKAYKNQSNQIELLELKDTFNIFRLTGPLSQAVLSSAFKCKPLQVNDRTWLGDFSKIEIAQKSHESQCEYWQKIREIKSPAELPPNMILALNIEDPRINRPKKRTKAMPDQLVGEQCTNSSIYKIPELNCYSAIWNATMRQKIYNDKMTTHDLCSLRNRHVLIPGQRCPFEDSLQPIPVLLAQRTGSLNSERLAYGCGWDVIVPAGYGISTWMCLIMWGAKPGGLRETDTMLREGRNEEFLPDTLTAQINDELVENELRQKYFKRPPNRRRNYKKLSIASPFRCPWSQLISEWSTNSNGSSAFYVLREKDALQRIEQCLLRHLKPSDINLPENCLIPIIIDMDGRGTAEKFSIICLPKKFDIKREQRMKNNLVNEPILTEPTKNDDQELARKTLRRNHLKLLKRLRRRRVRTKRRQQETAQRKILIVKSTTADLIAKQRHSMNEMWLPSLPKAIRQQCSRQVIGYLTQAHFSFVKAKVAGVGYITMNGLRNLLKISPKSGSPKVLIRDTSSANYRKATLKIRIN